MIWILIVLVTSDTELYDLESLLEGQSCSSRTTSDNELPDLPADMDVLRAKSNPSFMAY